MWDTRRITKEFPTPLGKEHLKEEGFNPGDIVQVASRARALGYARLFRTPDFGTVLYEVTSVSRDAKGNQIVFGRKKGTQEPSEEISFNRLEKVTIQ